MTKDNKQVSIVDNAPAYFEGKANELDELLDQIEISEQTKNEAMARAVVDAGRDAVLEAVPLVASYRRY